MATIAENLQSLVTCKNDIATAITNKGIILPENAGFRSFASAIDSIETETKNTFTFDGTTRYLNAASNHVSSRFDDAGNPFIISTIDGHNPDQIYDINTVHYLYPLLLNHLLTTTPSFQNSNHTIRIEFVPYFYFTNYNNISFSRKTGAYLTPPRITVGLCFCEKRTSDTAVQIVTNDTLSSMIISSNTVSTDSFTSSIQLAPVSFDYDTSGFTGTQYQKLCMRLYLYSAYGTAYVSSSYYPRICFKALNTKITLLE